MTRSRAEPAATRQNREAQPLIWFRAIDAGLSAFRWVIGCGTVIIVTYWLRDVLLAYAGQTTNANVALSLITDLKIDRILPYVVAGGGIAYGRQQRRLRQSNIKRLTERPQELERAIDPGRTSSGLAPDGTTNPGDL